MKSTNFTKEVLDAVVKARTWLESEAPRIQEELDLKYASVKAMSMDAEPKTRSGKRIPSVEAIYADELDFLEVHVFMAKAVQTYYNAVAEYVKPEYQRVFELYFNKDYPVDFIAEISGYSTARVYQIIAEETERICSMR